MNRQQRPSTTRRPAWQSWLLYTSVAVLCTLLIPACSPVPGGAPYGQGEGPGRREQPLAITPAQELELGRKAYRQILSRAQVVRGGPEVERVRRIGNRLVQASRIKPLQREINLRAKDHWFEWEFNVIRDPQVNAFCLPGGKVGVLTGLLEVAADDGQLAAVLAHEISHALAHHASERIAREQLHGAALQVVQSDFRDLQVNQQDRLLSQLSGLSGLAYERQQESEADHIGVFLMAFAGYEPKQAAVFWTRMQQLGRNRARPPEIFSSHPSDERRLAQLESWAPYARAAKKAYDEGHIVPGADR
jgi:predicted Zn-dependent protease